MHKTLTIAMQNYQKEMRRKLFCYLGITFLNRSVARFGNQTSQDRKLKFKMKIKITYYYKWQYIVII